MDLSKISCALLSVVAGSSFAANQSVVWGDAGKSLQQYQIQTPAKSMVKQAMPKSLRAVKSDYQLTYNKLGQSINNKHERYQIKYRGIPVWGHQLIFHQDATGKMMATGVQVQGIENDVSSLDAQLSLAEVQNQLISDLKEHKIKLFADLSIEKVKLKRGQKVIYLDNDNKAVLAYHVLLFTTDKNKQVVVPNFIVDANKGNVLKTWNDAHKEKVGQGFGGNAFDLPHRPGMFQHGDALPNLKSLGKVDVRIDTADNTCYVENTNFKVMSLMNIPLGYGPFPITVDDEKQLQLKAFNYPCDALSQYINYSDGQDGPMNFSFSPVNDTMYFAEETMEMYQTRYGLDKPFGDDLPLRAYTHLGMMDNAFAIPTIVYDGELIAHQQIVIGNGDMFLTAPAQSVIGHELSHNLTAVNSNLIYYGQSGGLNESFSDMAAIALEDHISQKYPWYWDGKDFSIGREAVIGGEPLRYMDDPTQDGVSIDNASDYYDGMEVHFSSGVFNKAFYLLSQKEGWGVQKAFEVMLDANVNYWSPIAYFDFAACGVVQAAVDKDYNSDDVVDAFEQVGVHCPVPPIPSEA